jgi:hypothetical protein
MDFYIYLSFSALWLAIGLLVGYKWHAWEVAQLEQCHAEREIEQRVSEPAPAKRDTSSAVHCLDQVDALLERLEAL